MKYIIQQNNIHAMIWQSRSTIGKDHFNILKSLSGSDILNPLNGKGMDIQGINLPRFTNQFRKRDQITSRSTAIIEYVETRLDSHFLYDTLTGKEEISKYVHESHNLEMKIGFGLMQNDGIRY